MSNTILLIGSPGVGKTWVMKAIINRFNCDKRQKYGKFYFHQSEEVIVVGKYDGTMFEGSDRLSMSVITDIDGFMAITQNRLVILEGDRFTNSKVISKMNPTIVKITGDGAEGRRKRDSNQTERHIKSITTRVNNIPLKLKDYVVNDSNEALDVITDLIITQKREI
jgi:adenylate kinase